MLALVGLIVSVTGGFGGGVVGGLVLLGEVPAQLASTRMATRIRTSWLDARFKISPVVRWTNARELVEFVTL
jgi:hypothetical protein